MRQIDNLFACVQFMSSAIRFFSLAFVYYVHSTIQQKTNRNEIYQEIWLFVVCVI